ncbi:MAG TPA: type I glyceraldehyde-3-phosphate dehydrogenase [Thermoleophilaceae bacterium]|nr:type I glyceraldehyde-3-phosphate dehydrogenase [Thermoleophilaceae bacterium]
MAVKVGINGFGRIGRNFFRASHERGADFEWVAINDIMDTQTMAHLLRHDSVLGRFVGEVEATDNGIRVDGTEIPVLSEPEPTNLPWGAMGVEVVMESSGKFTDEGEADQHLQAGAKKVIVSAPSKGDILTVVPGVNDDDYDPDQHDVISLASCTTNCLAPVAKVLHEAFGVEHGMMTTVHAYTADQQLHDGPHKDLRRARAAAVNLVPTTTGAASAIGKVIPELDGKLNGYAIRGPVNDGSVLDFTATLSRGVESEEEINQAFAERADKNELEGVLQYTDEPLVSSDIVKSRYSSVFDSGMTLLVDSNMVKVVAWYDNEYGYSQRLVDMVEKALP